MGEAQSKLQGASPPMTLWKQSSKVITEEKTRASTTPTQPSPKPFRPRVRQAVSTGDKINCVEFSKRREKILNSNQTVLPPNSTIREQKPPSLLRKTDACVNLFVPRNKSRTRISQTTAIPAIYSSGRSRIPTQTQAENPSIAVTPNTAVNPPSAYTEQIPSSGPPKEDNSSSDSDSDEIDWDALDNEEEESEEQEVQTRQISRSS